MCIYCLCLHYTDYTLHRVISSMTSEHCSCSCWCVLQLLLFCRSTYTCTSSTASEQCSCSCWCVLLLMLFCRATSSCRCSCVLLVVLLEKVMFGGKNHSSMKILWLQDVLYTDLTAGLCYIEWVHLQNCTLNWMWSWWPSTRWTADGGSQANPWAVGSSRMQSS